ncbi:hypothetical protein, partial [Streptomyces lonarensis]|uniref:hypothetical protein n=1 Tax=Streptomyces lonarensis TaxID=700599 RepID=UPI0035E41AC3
MQELRRQLELGPDPAEVRRAREWVRAQLDGGGGPGPGTPADTVVLLVSELVTNAVVHTGRPAVLRLLLPGEAHTHEEHEGPEEPPEERDARADERAGSAGRRARPAAGHREPSRPPEPARPVGRRTAAGEDRLDAPRPAAGARPGGAGAPTDATRVAAPSPEPGRPAAGSEAAMVVSLPGLLRLALPDHRPAGAVRGGAAPRPDGQHAEERRGVRRSAPETAAPDARPRAAGA